MYNIACKQFIENQKLQRILFFVFSGMRLLVHIEDTWFVNTNQNSKSTSMIIKRLSITFCIQSLNVPALEYLPE
jgi:hypothetical protein